MANPKITSTDVVGGTGVISDAVKNIFPSATRHYGNTAYDTNNKVIQDFASSIDFGNVYLANGETGIDALAGAPLASQTKSAIVLTNGTLPAAATFVISKLTSTSVATALGGTYVVPNIVLAGIACNDSSIQDISFGNTITSNITSTNDQDVYKIVLPKAGKINLNMTSSINSVNVDLEDTVSNKIIDNQYINGSEGSPLTWSKSADLEAGTYYFKVWKYSSYTGKYDLKVDYTAANNDDLEPNNGTLTAQLLILNSNPITGYISCNDSQDVYKIVLPKAGKINLNMTSSIDSVNVDLEDTVSNKIIDNQYIDGSEGSPLTWSKSADLEAGNLLFKNLEI